MTVLVADETLKKDVFMSTGSGYNTGQIDALPPSLEHLPTQVATMLRDDAKEVSRGNRASWPYIKRPACISEARMVRRGLGTRP